MTSTQRYRFWLIGFAVFIFLLYELKSMLLPFIASLAIAYFLDPLAERLVRLGLSRLLATALITLVFFGTGAVLLVLLVPVIEHQVMEFASNVPAYVAAITTRLEPLLGEAKQRLSTGDIEKLQTSLGEYAGTAVKWALGFVHGLLTGGLAIVNVLSLMFVTPVVTFYLLRDWHLMVGTVDRLLPREHAATVRTQLNEINRTLSGFLRGQATVCMVLSVIYAVGLTAVGLQLGLVIGLASGVLSFVPYLGTVVGLAVSLAVGFAQSGDWHLPVMAALVYLVGNIIEGSVLTPKLVGDKIGLHPAWIMFALLAGGALVGLVGMLLAVPVAAVIGVLVRFALRQYLDSPLYHGETRE